MPVLARRTPGTIWLVIAAGAALRLAWWAYAQPAPVSDFEYYRRLGEWLLAHGQIGISEPSAIRVPVYPAVLAALMLITKSIAWLSLANALMSAALPLVIYRVAIALAVDGRAAWLAALLCAIDPTFVLFSPVLASEHVFVLLLFGSLAALCTPRPDGPGWRRRSVIAGALFGACILTRPDALFYLPALGALAIVTAAPARRVRALLVFMLAATVVVFPWWLRNRIVIGPGAGLSTMGGRSFYHAHNPVVYGYQTLEGTPLAGLKELDRSRRGYDAGWDYIRNAPVKRLLADLRTATGRQYSITDDYGQFWSTRAPGATPDTFTSNAIGAKRPFSSVIVVWNVCLFALAAASLVFARRLGVKPILALYGIVVLNWAGYCVLFESTARYRYTAEVVFCVLAGITISAILQSVKRQAPGASPRKPL